jgi:hypothetical protein
MRIPGAARDGGRRSREGRRRKGELDKWARRRKRKEEALVGNSPLP